MMKRTSKLSHQLVGALCCVYAAVASTPVWSGSDCRGFSAVVDVNVLGPMGPGYGIAVLTLDDGQVFPAQVEAVFLDSRINEDGNILLDVQTRYDWGEGSTAIGIDRVLLKPKTQPGEFDFQMKMLLGGRSGVMAEAFGRYQGKGGASFNTGAVHHEGRGKVCGLKF